MKFIYDDGGRVAAGYGYDQYDCGIRAIAVATRQPYIRVRKRLSSLPKGAARRALFRRYMRSLGFRNILFGGKPFRRLPRVGRIVAVLNGHFCAIVNGCVHDTFIPAITPGYRRVCSYWTK